MDNLTHTLTAVLLSRAGLHRLHKRATLLLVLSANAPDLDVVSMAGGWTSYMFYHRWYTHSLLLWPVMALIAAGVVRLLHRKDPFHWGRAGILAFIGVGSHIFLDYTNPYGIRLMLPFSDEWPRLSTVNVVDIWIWLILFTAIAWPALSRLVSDEIGARRSRGQGLAITALAAILAYEGARWFLHTRAVEVQQSVLIHGAAPRRTFAVPDRVNPFRWKGIVETDTFYAVQPVDLSADDPLSDPRIQYKPVATPAIRAAMDTEVFRTFTKFSAVFLWQTTPEASVEGATKVEAIDLQLGFVASAIVDSQNRVVDTSVRF